MIPQAYITAWQLQAPWLQEEMVEQDLIISRVLVELFNDDHISQHLSFRGGTALYKLHLTPAPRYSEDIDLVQVDAGPIGSTIQAIRDILDTWLGTPNYEATQRSFRLVYRFGSENGTRSKLKIEINTREHIGSTTTIPFSVESRWFSGSANISTFPLEELLETKLRALYQRKKGRDLFDLDFALRTHTVDLDRTVVMFVRYLEAEGNRINTGDFIRNLEQKCEDHQFCDDIVPLIRPGTDYNVSKAADRIREELLSRIDEAWGRL